MAHQRITQTNGNSANQIKGSRLTIWTDGGEEVDQFVVPSQDGQGYCRRHPGGKYAKRLHKAVAKAEGEKS